MPASFNPGSFDIGGFDLDITLTDAALDEANRPTRRMLANACIGIDPFDAYYASLELFEALQAVHEECADAKAKLARILSTRCDDFQRCLYYSLAGRGVVQMLADLECCRRQPIEHPCPFCTSFALRALEPKTRLHDIVLYNEGVTIPGIFRRRTRRSLLIESALII